MIRSNKKLTSVRLFFEIFDLRMIPVAWILRKKRKLKDYKKVLGKIKEHAILLNVDSVTLKSRYNINLFNSE